MLRLARELAERRNAGEAEARAEVEALKRSLRERAEAIAAREKELAELQRRLEGRRPPKAKKSAGPDPESLVARERATLERGQALDAREKELRRRQAKLEAESRRVVERERLLAAAIATAEARRGESEAERELASAERRRLEEREQEARRIEGELASRRLELEALGGSAPAPASPSRGEPVDRHELELRRLEARIETRERELALMRQGIDSERNALLERERSLRRREAADIRQSFEAGLEPPSFSEGLAAFVRDRSRR